MRSEDILEPLRTQLFAGFIVLPKDDAAGLPFHRRLLTNLRGRFLDLIDKTQPSATTSVSYLAAAHFAPPTRESHWSHGGPLTGCTLAEGRRAPEGSDSQQKKCPVEGKYSQAS